MAQSPGHPGRPCCWSSKDGTNECGQSGHCHKQNKGACPAEGAQSPLHLTAFCLTDLVQGDWDLEREEITRWNQIETEMRMLLNKLGLEKTSGSLGPKERGPM